ncbi:hypothetical protein [Pedobacter foliorum]|uniref:hypothetical protein n=1 Tax=Pedobacter foliorum TaxID=2739058 RepID=UPI0015671DE2|nr:hypothetical protein [Pedobacter foliorum]NRF37193.1 hypothetical protein [Pedobacter foliorum]
MKKTIPFIVLLCLCYSALFAQVPKSTKKKVARAKSITNWEKDLKEENSDCAFYNKYTNEQRLAKYPFSKAAKVLAVSYKYRGFGQEPEGKQDESPRRGLYVNNGVLDTTTLIEIKQLSKKQINELTKLIFNTDYKKKDEMHFESFGKCFEPRNAFIFLSANDKVLDYIEICFTCSQNQPSSNKFYIGVLCTQKYQLFSDYFKNVGVVYGTLGKEYHEEDIKE